MAIVQVGLDSVFRHLEVLKLEGLGLSKVEIVIELTQKSAFTKRVIIETEGI